MVSWVDRFGDHALDKPADVCIIAHECRFRTPPGPGWLVLTKEVGSAARIRASAQGGANNGPSGRCRRRNRRHLR
jgi:hypothetical protein